MFVYLSVECDERLDVLEGALVEIVLGEKVEDALVGEADVDDERLVEQLLVLVEDGERLEENARRLVAPLHAEHGVGDAHEVVDVAGPLLNEALEDVVGLEAQEFVEHFFVDDGRECRLRARYVVAYGSQMVLFGEYEHLLLPRFGAQLDARAPRRSLLESVAHQQVVDEVQCHKLRTNAWVQISPYFIIVAFFCFTFYALLQLKQ